MDLLSLFRFLAAAGSVLTLQAAPTLAPLFRDHAVLQHGKPVPIWGSASPGETITVAFLDQTWATQASQDGRWKVALTPLLPTSTPATLVVTGEATVTVTDVLVGEVWLVSGQSNMEWMIKDSFGAEIDILASDRGPPVRQIKIPRAVADTPCSVLAGAAHTEGRWLSAGPSTTGVFTAVGYHFARDVADVLKIPVGIINCTWGGTRIEGWISAKTYAADPAVSPTLQRWQNDILPAYPAAKARHEEMLATWRNLKAVASTDGVPFTKPKPGGAWGPLGPGHPNSPSGLYNAMIHPLVPFPIRGVIWYQGESNAWHDADKYYAHFSALIRDWRAAFGQGDFPFYWAQLSSFGNPMETTWPLLREAQTKTLVLPNTGQAVTIDIGDTHDVHPRNKKDVGRRLALLALAHTYDYRLVASGPTFAGVNFSGDQAYITFKDTQGGLRTPFHTVLGFEIAGEDKQFHPASASIEGDSVMVKAPMVPFPVAVRYAWRNSSEAGLFNGHGLPATPFRTDDW